MLFQNKSKYLEYLAGRWFSHDTFEINNMQNQINAEKYLLKTEWFAENNFYKYFKMCVSHSHNLAQSDETRSKQTIVFLQSTQQQQRANTNLGGIVVVVHLY